MATRIPVGISPRASRANVKMVLFTEPLFVGTGSVNRWMLKVTAQTHAAMVEHAPKRTGKMAASIDSEVRHIGTKRITGVVGPTAPYSAYVLRGTGYPTKGHAGSIFTTEGFKAQAMGGYRQLWKPVAPKDREWAGQTRKKVSVRVRGHWLKVPPDLEFEGFIDFSVRGQEPNNFMLKAYREVRRRHRSLPLAPESVRNP